MITTKLISKDNNISKFITKDGKEIITQNMTSFIIGDIYKFQTDNIGFSKVMDSKGNVFNVLVI